MTQRRSLRLGCVFWALVGTTALAQDPAAICDRGEGVFYGAPFTLEQVYVIPGQARPEVPSADDLFPDPGDISGGADFSCDGGGLVGALDCVTEEIAGVSATSESPAPAMSQIEAEARAAVAGDKANAATPPPRVVRQLIVLKPVLIPGAPGTVSYVPDGAGGLEAPEDLTEAEIAALTPMIAARNAELLAFQVALSLEVQDDLIRGMPVPLLTPPLPDGISLAGDPAILAMGAECGALFRAMTETARLLQVRAEKVARIASLKAMLKAERDKAGLLGVLWDSEQADRIERLIAHEEDNLRKIDTRLGEHKATIDRRERWLANEDRARELEAIKADPERMAAETERRRAAIIEAAQEKAKARWLMIEGEAAYARQLAAHDAMIAAARENGEDALADKLEEDKSRLETARDSWRESAQSMIDVRTREEARLMKENAADGIGPVGDATSILLAEGKNPVEVIEGGARERARASAERRALTDSSTLGGSATETHDLVDFGQDLYETNLEMHKNPALFYRRFGSYVGGVGEAAYDGVVDLAVIGIEAGDLAGEAFESGLSDVTGYEYNAFGRENLDTLVATGGALSEVDALKIGELAVRVAEAADRRVSGMAASGEEGIRDALSTTGYIAGSVLGAEELAMAGTLRLASAIRNASRGAEALADASKLAEGVTDAARVADAAKLDAPTLDATVTPDVPVTPAVPVTPVADDLADTAKVDSEDLIETVRIDPPVPDSPPIPDPIDPDKTSPVPPPDPDAAPVDPDAPTTPEPGPDAAPVDPDAPTTPEPGPDAAPVDRDTPTTPEPDADAVPVDRDAPTTPDPDADAVPTDPDAPTTPDPDADAVPVDRDTPTTPEPDADAVPVDRDAPTTPDPDADAVPVDRDAPTSSEPDADAVPVDRDAPTTPEPDLTADVTTDATAAPNLDEAVDLPTSDPDPPLNPLDPAKEPLNDPYGDTEPPSADTEPPLAEDAPLAPVDEANLARGPPESPRDLEPIDKTKLDGEVDNSEGYKFRKPLYDPALIPKGGAFGGDVSFATNAGTTRQIPGQNVTAPDGTLLELGPLIDTGATATVFASKTDPSKVIRLVEFTDPTAGALDAVGRKVGEAIQNPSGNGNFRLTVVKEQFTAIDPATGNKWLVTVEENLAVTGQGITNAKKRFAKRPPNAAEELTMALAMREMADKGVVWTDHKPANFDLVPNKKAPTGYQMVIFDTGGIRPVTGASPKSRAVTALEVQHTFDSIPPGNSPLFEQFKGNYRFAKSHLDDRVFGVDEMEVTITLGSLNRADGYIELSSMSDEALETHARTILGPDFEMLPGP